MLAGNVPPPPEFAPVYDLLSQLLAETAPAQKVERRGSRHGPRLTDEELGMAGGGLSGSGSRRMAPPQGLNGGGAGGSGTRRVSPPLSGPVH